MDENPPVTGLRALARKLALEKAMELSGPQAHELWCAMQIIATNKSLEGLPRSAVELAMDFDHFPVARKVVEEKALVYKRNTAKQKP